MITHFESRLVKMQELQLHLYDWGNDTEKPLIFVHGLASTGRMFDLIAPELTQNYQVYAYDQRGHGQSSKPTTGYDFEQIADDLDSLLESLNIQQPIVLVGHSWGAFTTLYYSATRPEKVAKAILLDGGTTRFKTRYPTWTEGERALAPPIYENRTLESIKHMIKEHWLGGYFRPELEALALSIFNTQDEKNVKPHLDRANHMAIARSLWKFESTQHYEQVRCPTLIVNAVQGDIPSERALDTQLAQEQISDVRIIWMEDTAHDIPWHRPQALSIHLKNFLTG